MQASLFPLSCVHACHATSGGRRCAKASSVPQVRLSACMRAYTHLHTKKCKTDVCLCGGRRNDRKDFEQEIKFANDKQKQDAFNAAFVSVCSTGVKKEVDLLLSHVRISRKKDRVRERDREGRDGGEGEEEGEWGTAGRNRNVLDSQVLQTSSDRFGCGSTFSSFHHHTYDKSAFCCQSPDHLDLWLQRVSISRPRLTARRRAQSSSPASCGLRMADSSTWSRNSSQSKSLPPLPFTVTVTYML